VGSVTSKFIPVPKLLQRDVACINVIDYSGDTDVAFNVAPGCVPGLVFQHVQGRTAIQQITTKSGVEHHPPLAFLYGPGLKPSVMHYAAGTYTTIHVIFRPHALNSLMGINAAELTDTYVTLNAFARTNADDQLLNTQNVDDQVKILLRLLGRFQDQRTSHDEAIEQGLHYIHQHIGSVAVRDVHQELFLSEREFQRRFRQAVGVSPRSYIRVQRFQEAIRLIKAGNHTRLTDIAHELNYYDQAHLIRDVRAFTGMPPKAILHNDADLHHEHTGYASFDTP